ncbi:hypothetical protein O181_010653 [Austropuccinia psidii MF-1]|uniref:GH26 domain-containing protein n=1 Tax=Austropuccinia psidii MF-1 TaxID=1389203 RepID=A0A9Q3BTR6_9BASI|nr:hypothetical protein [Austropuccinia psidii MF-1]
MSKNTLLVYSLELHDPRHLPKSAGGSLHIGDHLPQELKKSPVEMEQTYNIASWPNRVLTRYPSNFDFQSVKHVISISVVDLSGKMLFRSIPIHFLTIAMKLRFLFFGVSIFTFFNFLSGKKTQSHKLKANQESECSTLGLNSDNLNFQGIAFGAIPAFKEPIHPNTPAQINSKLPRPISIMGDYVGLGRNAEGLKKIDWHLETLLSLPGPPVYQIALMPDHGLLSVSHLVINRIADKMAEINEKNVTVWLRFAHEMNGQWYRWGLNPWVFKQKWRSLTRAVRSRAPDTYMMWSPNVRFGASVDSIKGGYTPYWPGSDYVDIAGLSYYHFGGRERNNILPEATAAINNISEFANLYGLKGEGKPIVLAETAAPYTRSVATKKPVRGGAPELNIKLAWLKQLFSEKMKKAVPELRAISWFEVVKVEKAPESNTNKLEDFRLLLGDEATQEQAIDFLNGDEVTNDDPTCILRQ